MRCGSLVFALALAAASPALAQTAPEQQPAQPAAPGGAQTAEQRFQAYVTSGAYKSFIGQIAAQGDAITAPDCNDHKPSKRADLILYALPQFGTGEHPAKGLWTDRIAVNRCGKEVLQNILVQATGETTPPRAALMIPGTSRANPPLQEKIIKEILDGLAKKKCTDQTQIVPFDSVKEKDTTPIQVSPDGHITQGAWKETWTMRACGKMVKATIDIAADGKGGLAPKVKM